MHKLLFVLVVIIISLTSNQSNIVEGKASFSIDLIHRDSPLSPSYNKSESPSEILRKAAIRSKARVNYFNSFKSGTTSSNVESTVFPNEGEYLMKLYIGSPPKPFLAIADTGSDLIWVQCTSCQKCFNSSKSSTYNPISCSSQSCRTLPKYACSVDSNSCVYDYRYADGSTFTKGILSTDTISLDSTTGQIVSFPASVFGCGYDYAGTVFFHGPSSGLVGLGGGPLSLVSQLGDEIDYKFAYCLLHYSSKYTSKLRFGQDAVLSGPKVYSTPILVDATNPTFYYLTLLGISVGSRTTQTPQFRGNIIIDSGTTYTNLAPSLYNELEVFVRLAIPLQPVQDTSNAFNLCFDATSVSSVQLPYVIFHFDGVDLSLSGDNLFVPYNDMVCMSIIPTNGNVSIFGNLAQMHYAVGYDLKLGKVSFAAADCTTF